MRNIFRPHTAVTIQSRRFIQALSAIWNSKSRVLPSISDILSDFDKVWTVMEINAGYYSHEDIEDEQTVLQRHKLRTEDY